MKNTKNVQPFLHVQIFLFFFSPYVMRHMNSAMAEDFLFVSAVYYLQSQKTMSDSLLVPCRTLDELILITCWVGHHS